MRCLHLLIPTKPSIHFSSSGSSIQLDIDRVSVGGYLQVGMAHQQKGRTVLSLQPKSLSSSHSHLLSALVETLLALALATVRHTGSSLPLVLIRCLRVIRNHCISNILQLQVLLIPHESVTNHINICYIITSEKSGELGWQFSPSTLLRSEFNMQSFFYLEGYKIHLLTYHC